MLVVQTVMDEQELAVVIRPCRINPVDIDGGMRDRYIIDAVQHRNLQVRCLYSATKEEEAQEDNRKEAGAISIHDKVSLPAHISAIRSISRLLRAPGQGAYPRPVPASGAGLLQQ